MRGGNLVTIKIDDLTGPDIAELLQEHLRDMNSVSPPESKHALDLEGLRQPDITFWTIWEEGNLAGCGALKKLTPHHAEIKSMRTARSFVRKGVATKMLNHMIAEATEHGYQRLSLETGSQPYFEPARKLYARFGFSVCAPFADYIEDPNSVFMTREL
jgi:putative acetyltransferase